MSVKLVRYEYKSKTNLLNKRYKNAIKLTLYKRRIQPFNVIAVGAIHQHFIRDDRYREKEYRQYRYGERERTQPCADPVYSDLIFVGAEVVFLASTFESAQQGKTEEV